MRDSPAARSSCLSGHRFWGTTVYEIVDTDINLYSKDTIGPDGVLTSSR
jgi:hypothetical protein